MRIAIGFAWVFGLFQLVNLIGCLINGSFFQIIELASISIWWIVPFLAIPATCLALLLHCLFKIKLESVVQGNVKEIQLAPLLFLASAANLSTPVGFGSLPETFDFGFFAIKCILSVLSLSMSVIMILGSQSATTEAEQTAS